MYVCVRVRVCVWGRRSWEKSKEREMKMKMKMKREMKEKKMNKETGEKRKL